MTTRTFASIAAALAMSACGGEPLRMTSAGGVDMSGARGGAIETRRPPPAEDRAEIEPEVEGERTLVDVPTPPVDAPTEAVVVTTTTQGEIAESDAAPTVEESPPRSDERRRRERRSRRRRGQR